jgi:hypothetical protein
VRAGALASVMLASARAGGSVAVRMRAEHQRAHPEGLESGPQGKLETRQVLSWTAGVVARMREVQTD